MYPARSGTASSPVLPIATAGPKWWRDAAAAMGMSTQELPQEPHAVVQLLHHTLPSYVQLLLGDQAKPWNDPHHLSVPLQRAAGAGSSVAVALIISAAPSVFWRPWILSNAIYAAVASRGNLAIFQQLVAAAAAAAPNDYKATVFCFTVHFHRCCSPSCRATISWLLEQHNWQPEEVANAITSSVARKGKHHLLHQLLGDTGIQWTPAQLSQHLAEAAAMNEPSLVNTIMSATAEQWQPEHITPAIQRLISWRGEADNCVLKLLLGWPGVSWTSAAVAGLLVECLGWLSLPWPAHLCWVLQELLTLLHGSWTAESLAELLRVCSGTQDKAGLLVVQLLLEVPGVQWTPTQLVPALAEAAATEATGSVCASPMVEQLMGFPGVQWFSGDVAPILTAAAAGAVTAAAEDFDGRLHWELVEQLLSAPGVHWTAPDLAPALKEAAAADDPCLVMLLFGDPECSSYAKAIDKDLLQHLHDLEWSPSDLSSALLEAVAEGRRGMMGPLLHAGGERWQCGQLAPALLNAIALLNEEKEPVEGWEGGWEDQEDPFLTMREVDKLLQQPGIEWSAALLAPVVTAAVKAGCSCACLACVMSATRDAWHADQLLPALQQSAAAGGQPQQLRMLLQVPGVKWEAGKLAAMLEQLMEQSNNQLLVEDCSSTQLLNAPVSSYSQIKEILAVKGVQWQPQQLEGLLVRAAEEGPSELLSQVLAMVLWEVEGHCC